MNNGRKTVTHELHTIQQHHAHLAANVTNVLNIVHLYISRQYASFLLGFLMLVTRLCVCSHSYLLKF